MIRLAVNFLLKLLLLIKFGISITSKHQKSLSLSIGITDPVSMNILHKHYFKNDDIDDDWFDLKTKLTQTE